MGEQSPVADPCPVGPCSGLGPDRLGHCPCAPGARLEAGDTAKGWGQRLGSPCSSTGLGCPQHPWGCGSFCPSTHQSLSPRVQPLVRTRGTSADLRGEPSQAAVQFCPGTPVTPRAVAGSSGEGAGRLHALPFDCGDLRQAGAGGPRAGRAGDVPAPPAGARSCRPGTSVIFIRGKTMSIIYPQHFPCRWGADLGCR